MTVDSGNLAIAILAVAISVVSLYQSWKVDRENLKLQRRVTQIEEARREEEVAHFTQADLHATLRSGAEEGTYILVLMNSGGTKAEYVNVESAASPGLRNMPVLGSYPFPVAVLHPGDQVTSDVYFPIRSGRMFDATITWTDPRGPQSKTQTVTFSPD